MCTVQDFSGFEEKNSSKPTNAKEKVSRVSSKCVNSSPWDYCLQSSETCQCEIGDSNGKRKTF